MLVNDLKAVMQGFTNLNKRGCERKTQPFYPAGIPPFQVQKWGEPG